AADRGHGMGGVEREGSRWYRAHLRLRREPAVAAQVERRLDRPRQRPLVLLAPAPAVVELALRGLTARPAAHHEEPDRRLAIRLARGVVRQPAREVLELLVEVPLDAPDAVAAEVDLVAEGGVPSHADMAPGADHEPLRRRVLGRHRREVI